MKTDESKVANLSNTEIAILLATLCDGMKRLEMAILSNSPTDRCGYVEQATEKRKKVEDKLFQSVIDKPLIT